MKSVRYSRFWQLGTSHILRDKTQFANVGDLLCDVPCVCSLLSDYAIEID